MWPYIAVELAMCPRSDMFEISPTGTFAVEWEPRLCIVLFGVIPLYGLFLLPTLSKPEPIVVEKAVFVWRRDVPPRSTNFLSST